MAEVAFTLNAERFDTNDRRPRICLIVAQLLTLRQLTFETVAINARSVDRYRL